MSQKFLTEPAPSRAIFKLLQKNLNNEEYIEYQFWQKSKIPTLHFQKALPRLPVPKLNDTCARYLAAQRPLLIDESYRKTEDNVNKFKASVGKQLQSLLIEFDRNNKHTSYISELWFDKYLKDRVPLPLNYNPMLVLHDGPKAEYNTQLIRGSNLIISSLRFYKALKADLLEPDVFHLFPKNSDNEGFKNICSKLPPFLAYGYAFVKKAYPLDMSQYPNLFASTRIPEIDKDRLLITPNSKHVSVQYKGNFYSFQVLNDDFDILPANEIMEGLRFILADTRQPAEFPIGVLTTLNRNDWAIIRHNFAENGNEATLKAIDSALFHICLDSDSIGSDPVKVTKKFLHGDGTNRWFDKSFSLIVAADGVSAINFEHSWGDGVAVLRYAQDVFKDSGENPRVHPDTKSSKNLPKIQALDIHLNDALKNQISEAQKKYNTIWKNLDVNYAVYEGIGKTICKKNNVSPDAVMQLAFQVAYHKMTGTFVSTYESCSTAAFKHGRTEAIRPCTTATKDFVLSVNTANKPSVAELKAKVSNCSDVHNRLIKEAAMGQGFDRHLFALKTMALKNNIQTNMFEDPEYEHVGQDIMSTSTLNSPAIYAGGFGPVAKNGLGIAYVIKDEYLGMLATNYLDGQNGPAFTAALKEAIAEIFRVLNN